MAGSANVVSPFLPGSALPAQAARQDYRQEDQKTGAFGDRNKVAILLARQSASGIRPAGPSSQLIGQ
jgi:hypothetical protein